MIRIITDSAIDLSEEMTKRVIKVPLTVAFGEEEYLDGIDLSKNEFYERLVTCEQLPTTSQASPARFEEIFQEITDAGDSAVVLALSSKLSGTCQSACIAAQDFPNIRVVDTLQATISGGILVEYALRCVDEGMDLDTLEQELLLKREDITLVAIVDTLKYLEKGGRISKLTAFAGGVLNVKPSITIKDGEVAVVGKARGSKNANNLMIQKINEVGVDYSMPILLAYSGTSDTLLQKYIADSKQLWEGKLEKLDIAQLCTVVGCHIGPGAIAVAFFRAH